MAPAAVEGLGEAGRVGLEVGDVAGELSGDVGDDRDGVGEVLGQEHQGRVVGGGERALREGEGGGGVLRAGPPRRGRR